jgi:flagellar biosynthetic protein FlhB
MAEADQDRTEPATPYKREEARRRGQVAKSLDTNSFFILAAALVAMLLWGSQLLSEGARTFQEVFSMAGTLSFDPVSLNRWGAAVMRASLYSLTPPLLLVIAAGLLANLVQTGPVFSTHPLKADFQRLNPLQGFKRIYSSKALFEILKSLLKLSLFAAVAYRVIVTLLPATLALSGEAPRALPRRVLADLESLAWQLLLVLLVIALLDLAYVRWDYAKKLRMSRREQKEEIKRREGDPHIRAKRRELQREAAKRSGSLRRVPDADVLITNPTHLAIALQYQRGRAVAPRCIAKGAGETALHMKEMAARHGVQIVEQRALARALFEEVEIDALIPESLYEPVARVYAEVARHTSTRPKPLLEVHR